jgi:hypothetical protein
VARSRPARIAMSAVIGMTSQWRSRNASSHAVIWGFGFALRPFHSSSSVMMLSAIEPT